MFSKIVTICILVVNSYDLNCAHQTCLAIVTSYNCSNTIILIYDITMVKYVLIVCCISGKYLCRHIRWYWKLFEFSQYLKKDAVGKSRILSKMASRSYSMNCSNVWSTRYSSFQDGKSFRFTAVTIHLS